MRRRWTLLAAALSIVVLGGAGKPPATVQRWLHAFNTDNAAALKALGDESAMYDHDIVEETGGLTFVKMDSDGGHKIVATAREKLSPETWHLTLVRDPADPSRFKTIHRYADPMHSMKDTLAALNDFAARMRAADKFSGTLMIANNGKPLYAKAFGTMGPGRPANTLKTKVHYASLGKLFTATAVLQLVEAEKLSLDTPIIKYLPDYPNKAVAKEVTIRMLLMQRDGLGNINLIEPEYAANRAKVHSLADIIAMNAGRKPEFKPGSKFYYNNFSYALLGWIVQRVSGEDYYAYVRAHVFEPAGMTRTSYPLRDDLSGIATPMTQMVNPTLHSAIKDFPWRGTPAGGGVSTAGDLVRFTTALAHGKLISKNLLAEAVKPTPSHVGFGFIISGMDGFNYWGHGGDGLGASSVVDYYQQTGVSFACLANRDPIICERLAGYFFFRAPRPNK
jgi:CubicO group peptidase (beta-lactamase class C family)